MRAFLSIILFSFLFVFGCKNKPSTEDPQPEDPTDTIQISDTVFVNKSSVVYSADAKASVIVINADAHWTATTSESWVTLSQESGDSGSVAIILRVDENLQVPRRATVTFSTNSKSHTISISQSAGDEISFTYNGVSFKMILVEGGEFTMGNSERIEFTSTSHQVKLSNFYICETEVTNELWQAVMGSLPYDTISYFDGNDEDVHLQYPVSGIDWYAVTNTFLPELSSLGFTFSLPTEAQWEYAAMGGKYSNNYMYAGSNEQKDYVWNDFNSEGTKHNVKSLLPNELGLYDMSGNVREWCADWYAYNYIDEDAYWNQVAESNPKGPLTGTEKVLRGGDYTTTELIGYSECAVKYRSRETPNLTRGCWGNTGSPDEPVCYFGKATGFRFIIAF